MASPLCFVLCVRCAIFLSSGAKGPDGLLAVFGGCAGGANVFVWSEVFVDVVL